MYVPHILLNEKTLPWRFSIYYLIYNNQIVAYFLIKPL